MTQQLARKLLKVITTTLTVFISICFIVYSAIQMFRFIDIQPRYDKEETQLFENHRAEFELLNNYVIENFGNEPEKREIILIIRQAIEITGFYNNEDIRIDKPIRKALNSIDDCFKNYDFSHVEITDERISYGGLGYRMYVFSRNGKAPKYYYHEGDGMHPEVYKLDENWYLLTVNYR